MSDDRSAASTGRRGRVTRREALAAIGGAALATPLRPGVDTDSTGTTATDPLPNGPVRIRVYPSFVPLQARLRYGLGELRGNWPPPFRDALAAIESAFEQVIAYARERSRLEDLEVRVDRGAPVLFSLPSIPSSVDSVLPSLEALLERFRERLRERDAPVRRTCHVLLRWAPLNYRVGYGGTVAPNSMTGSDAGDTGAQTVANVGATEFWDSRAVTRNMVIHETLHTFLEDDIVHSVGDTYCDHELGVAVRTADDTLQISPIATAYAGPDRIGGGTRFHGTGCYDHDRFARHDGTEGIENWVYTTELSEATCEAVTRFLEHRFAG
ncbi:hypothetical protein [Natrinema halophilum]|uniref:Uncharacterized protein n=1 Tax=Natrinema halophilum TaxID=1699371 RepID=A0A7D5GIU7_9EURY|nr:hypothetical protein [Natrinema halophilum]QLG49987.1 hypothetical protein HYG82_14550 [Natrinema halophilum]